MIITKEVKDLTVSLIRKAFQDIGFELDTIYKFEENEAQEVVFIPMYRFQVTTVETEYESIEWKYHTINLEFDQMGLMRAYGDNHFDGLYKLIQDKIRRSMAFEKAQGTLSLNQKLVVNKNGNKEEV